MSDGRTLRVNTIPNQIIEVLKGSSVPLDVPDIVNLSGLRDIQVIQALSKMTRNRKTMCFKEQGQRKKYAIRVCEVLEKEEKKIPSSPLVNVIFQILKSKMKPVSTNFLEYKTGADPSEVLNALRHLRKINKVNQHENTWQIK